jgi:citrate synthase
VLTDSASNKSSTLPIVKGSLGDPAIDIGKLNKDTGYFTYDPGFMSTAACRSSVTFIDGDKGVLLYRGYPIEQLAKHSSFLEVAYLLINGDLPTQAEFSGFEDEITHHTMMRETLKNFLNGFHYDAHPMAMLCASVGSLAAFYHDSLDMKRSAQRRLAGDPPDREGADDRGGVLSLFDRLADPLPAQQSRIRHALPDDDVRGAKRATPTQPGRGQGARPAVHPARRPRTECEHLDRAPRRLDRRQSVRLRCRRHRRAVGSRAWRRERSGAEMLGEIGDTKNVGKAVERAKDKNSGFRLMGFGHRVYKNFDPRATIIREMCHKVLADLGVNDPLLDVAMALKSSR